MPVETGRFTLNIECAANGGNGAVALAWQVEYSMVDAQGLNIEELIANKRLNRRVVHDLNKNSTLPFESNT